MPKLICGLSKEIQLPDGSRRASVRLEVELEPATLRQPEKLKQHIRCGFDRVREAIEEELCRAPPVPAASLPQQGVGERLNGHVRRKAR